MDYNIFRKDRPTRGGGVLIGVKPFLKCIELEIITVFECISIEILESNNIFLFINLYIPPNKYSHDYIYDNLKTMLKNISTSKYKTIYITGDLNINFSLSNKNSFASTVLELFLFYGFNQKVTDITYRKSNNILDIVFVNDDNFYDLEIIENISNTCDHEAIKFSISLRPDSKPEKKYKTIYNFNDNNIKILNQKLFMSDWDEFCLNDRNINNIFNSIKTHFQKLLNETIPTKTIILNKKVNKFSKYIKKLIYKKRKISKNLKSNPNLKTIYESIQSKIKNEIEISDNNKINKIISKSKNFKQFYKYISSFSKSTLNNIFINDNNKQILDKKEILENFNEYFNSNYNKRIIDLNQIDFEIENNELPQIDISLNDILNAYKYFKFNKSEGLTFISNHILKNCLNGSTKLLYFLFNKILFYREIPYEMLLTRISPILKKGKNKNRFSSYRGVSVQPNLLRIFETILLNKINFYIFENNLIPNEQYGYKKNVGISHQHLDIQKLIFDGLNDKNVLCIDLIFLDLSNAFDTVPHDKLLQILYDKGIKGQYLTQMKNSLTNRKQYIELDNLCSVPINVKSGCAQGGVLSPFHYNIYVSDLPQILNCKNFEWADDTVLCSQIKDINDIHKLQTDLNNVDNYCLNKELTLNENKSKHLRITFRHKDLPLYTLKNKSIENTSIHKHLGVTYDMKMTFNDHCSDIITKSMRKYNILKNICKSVNGITFLNLYKTYVLPIIEYSNNCWVPNKSQSERIEKIQRKISKYICYKMGKQDLKYEDRLKLLNIFSLKTRREANALKLIFNIKQSPNNFPNWTQLLEFYTTSRNGIFIKPNLSSDKYFFNHYLKLFNTLPIDTRSEINYTTFVNKLYCIL